ncbi:MAG: ABC transporter substrate-binding protein [Thermodesulfobacteriota bacterium]
MLGISLKHGPGQSRFKKPQDIKGGKIGVFSIASTTTAFGLLALKRVGLSGKDVKFVGVGGQPARVAAVKSGAIDGFVQAYHSNVNLIVRGEVRPLINIGNYLPKPWIEGTYVAHKDFIAKNPKVVMKTLRGIFQAIDYVRVHREWAAQKLVVKIHYSPAGAKLAVDEKVLYPQLGRKISRRALENVINFLVEYRFMKREKLPSVDAMLHPSEYTR